MARSPGRSTQTDALTRVTAPVAGSCRLWAAACSARQHWRTGTAGPPAEWGGFGDL